LAALQKLDDIFDVLTDNDAAKIGRIVAWAEAEGKPVAPEARELAQTTGMADEVIASLVADMQAARKARDFARADTLRAQLNEAGIIVEITKDGARWKRK